MEKDRVERYAVSLEHTIKNDYLYLKEAVDNFQEMCRIVTPERSVPQGIMIDIREMYKEIRTRLTEIKAIQQLLQGKYRHYYRRDSVRDKEITEFGFIAKNCYSKFEYVLKQKLELEKVKTGESKETSQGRDRDLPFKWFHSKENQIALIKNIRLLKELAYQYVPGSENEEKRSLSDERSLTLFLLRGEPSSLDQFQSRIRFREHDTVERFRQDEVRGALTHLKKVLPSQIEEVFQRMLKEKGFSNMRGLLLPIRSQQDLRRSLFNRVETVLVEMKEGEVKTIFD